jgi:hypothetical protein
MAVYTHTELEQEVEALAGSYTPLKEVRLPYKDREVLYVVGQMLVDASCCGFANMGYITVPGYLVNWQCSTNENGCPVSDVEPITSENEQREIAAIIKGTEHMPQVDFWQ